VKKELQYLKNNKIIIKGKKERNGIYENFDLDIYGNHFDGSGIVDFQILRESEPKGLIGKGHLVVIFESPYIEINEEDK